MKEDLARRSWGGEGGAEHVNYPVLFYPERNGAFQGLKELKQRVRSSNASFPRIPLAPVVGRDWRARPVIINLVRGLRRGRGTGSLVGQGTRKEHAGN